MSMPLSLLYHFLDGVSKAQYWNVWGGGFHYILYCCYAIQWHATCDSAGLQGAAAVLFVSHNVM